jgi:hypothetical protein
MTSTLPALRYDQTVPCAVAHRRALGEVFVADSMRADDGSVFLAVQVPRAHSLWFDRTVPFHDTFSMAEAARQGSFVALHRHFDVPVGLPFTLQRFEFRVEDLVSYRDNQHSPLEGIVRYQTSGQIQPGAESGQLTLEGQLWIDDSLAMSMNADVIFLGKDDYEALRAFQRTRIPAAPPPPDRADRLPPAAVGRLDQRNVVIADGAEPAGEPRFRLVVDDSHPSFFDHEYDHLPGPLAVEGFRQSALVAATRAGLLDSPVAAVTGCLTGFVNFAELDAVAECSAVPASAAANGSVTVEVGLHQFGRQLAAGWVELTPYPR